MVNNAEKYPAYSQAVLSARSRARLFVCLGAAGFLGAVLYGFGGRDRPVAAAALPLPAASPPAAMVVATRPIASGQVIAAADLATRKPRDGVPPGIVTDMDDALGRIAAAGIETGQPLRRAALVEAATLAPHIPRGYRAISLQTTDEIAVAGLVRPGDRVDVQLVLRGDSPGGGTGGEARALIQNVPVLAVGAVVSGARDAASVEAAARTVTLALQPRDVAAFTLARSLGSIYLALRNPAEPFTAAATGAVMLHDIRGRTAPATPAPRLRLAANAPRHMIELVVGGESRTLIAGGGQ